MSDIHLLDITLSPTHLLPPTPPPFHSLLLTPTNTSVRTYLQSAVTICTVGFGDLSPKTDNGRVFTIFYALIGCTLSVKAFSEVVRFPILLKLKQNEMHVSDYIHILIFCLLYIYYFF